MNVILDTNIYDLLREDNITRKLISTSILSNKLTIIMPRSVSEELFKSPFKRIPNYFPIKHVGNTVGNVNMAVCDSIGSGNTYKEHKGNSKNINDAYISDAACYYANWLISEDKRLLKRNSLLCERVVSMKYNRFIKKLKEL